MSNLARAVEVLREAYRETSMSPVHACEIMANALQAAGLLAPDLPAYAEAGADNAWWYADTYGIGVGRLTKNSPVRVMLWDSEPGGVLYTNTETARDYALKILAACEYAEKEQDNE